MFSFRCFKENCQNKLFAKCDCEGNVLFCQEHSFEHLLKPSSNRHQLMRLYFKPAEEIKQPVIQKLIELKKEIQIYKKQSIADANQIIRSFNEAFEKYLNQIKEVNKRCSKMLNALQREEEFLDFTAENDIESVLKLDIQKAHIKMAGWSTSWCHLDYKEIKAVISKTYETSSFDPFSHFESSDKDEVEWMELSFFKNGTSDFFTINLDNLEVSSTTTLATKEKIHAFTSKCMLPDKTYFYCCNCSDISGMVFTIDKNKAVKQLQKSKVNYCLDPVYHKNCIYLIGGDNKLAEKYSFEQDLWQSIASLPESLNFRTSCSILFEDLILITGEHLQKIICYSINQNNYQDIKNLELEDSCRKFMLKCNNRIYLFERGKRVFESAENDISNWACIGSNSLSNGNRFHQSVVVRYKGSLYFVEYNNELWRFDLSSKQLSKLKQF